MAKKKSLGEPEVNGVAELPPPEAPPPAHAREGPRPAPVHTVRYANIQGCVWEVARPDGSVWFNCTFMRLYRTTDAWGRGIEAASYPYALRDMAYLEKAVAAFFEWVNAQYAADAPF